MSEKQICNTNKTVVYPVHKSIKRKQIPATNLTHGKHINYNERKIKATVVNRCSKVINQLRDNKSGLQTKTEGNTWFYG